MHKAIEHPNVQTVQIIFNMLRYRSSELFFEQAKRWRVGILPRVPLASGMLAGKITKHPSLPPTMANIRVIYDCYICSQVHQRW